MPPRRTSQAVKKDPEAADAKNEGSAPRRSGRAVSKPETSAREASRSRRSSTAAQTAASVADSKTPKGRSSVSSRRDSTSPSDLPSARVKTARRSTGRINYKESDGEEEVAAPKYDENFDSGDEFNDSDSDEKSKPKGKGKVTKLPTKKRSTAKSKAPARSRRGRPIKKKRNDDEEEEEENETFDVSDDSGEPEEVTTKKVKAVKEKEPPKPSRSRRQRSEVMEVKLEEEKPKPSRRSGRAALNKDESTKKRPSRSVQAKRYAEDDDVEEIETKVHEEVDSVVEGKRKRKRGASPDEMNKRVKGGDEDILKDEEKVESVDDEPTEVKPEEAMEVDESDSSDELLETKMDEVKKDESVDSKIDKVGDTSEDIDEDKKELNEKINELNKQESVESSENLDESIHSSNSEPESSNVVQSESSISQDTKVESKPVETIIEKSADKPKEDTSDTPEISQPIEEKSVKEKNLIPPVTSETKPEVVESSHDPPTEQDDSSKNDSPISEGCKPLTIDETSTTSGSPASVVTTQPKDTNQDAMLNGSEKTEAVLNITHDIQKTTNVNSEPTEKSMPTENGAHDDIQHTNSTPPTDQYYSLPGRKYVSNSKLSDSVRQSIKNYTFGFVSYNLGISSSDAYLQKEKLLNELNQLDARIICLQQVAKPFYNAVLEPSLDALGFKGVFSQPEDSLKGVATFYKTSLFRFIKKTDISLRQLIEKELETSSLSTEDRAAVKTHIKKCGNVLFMQFSAVIGTQSITVANVQIPPTELSVRALQVSCLAREVIRINGGTNMPLLLGGEFNLSENDVSYQLLRDGYLSNDMIDELQRRKDIVLPGKENASLLNVLWKSFQHPSYNLCSCYTSVLDHEFSIPETKRTSPDLLWFSSNSLHTMGVLDVVLDKPADHHFSLKADIAFSV